MITNKDLKIYTSGAARIKGETAEKKTTAAKSKTPAPVDNTPFSVCFPSPLPPSANKFQRSAIRQTAAGKYYPARYTTAAAKSWKEVFQQRAQLAGLRGGPRWGLIQVVIYLRAEAEELDVDNGNKLLLDALKGIAYFDDKQVRRLEIIGMGRPSDGDSHIVVHVSRYFPQEISIPQFSGVTLR